MPCNSDYMEASGKEVAMSQVACLLDELNGNPIDKDDWRGYHPKVYNRRYDADTLVAELCSALQLVDVSDYSLEMQLWWRDHQAADRKRLSLEVKKQEEASDREEALAKLTTHERKILGV